MTVWERSRDMNGFESIAEAIWTVSLPAGPLPRRCRARSRGGRGRGARRCSKPLFSRWRLPALQSRGWGGGGISAWGTPALGDSLHGKLSVGERGCEAGSREIAGGAWRRRPSGVGASPEIGQTSNSQKPWTALCSSQCSPARVDPTVVVLRGAQLAAGGFFIFLPLLFRRQEMAAACIPSGQIVWCAVAKLGVV